MSKKEYVKCYECKYCKPQEGKKDGVRWGVCGQGGNTMHLEPWKERRHSGRGWIHYDADSCGMWTKEQAGIQEPEEMMVNSYGIQKP